MASGIGPRRAAGGGARIRKPCRWHAAAMTRGRGLWAFGIAAVVLFALLGVADREMQDAGGPGIVPFELAWSSERAAEILAEWGEEGQDAARLSLWLDFPFLAAYAGFLTLAVLAVRDTASARGRSRYARPATAIAALPAIAAAFDAVENVNLLLVLDGDADTAAPTVAAVFATAKFVVLAVVLLYLLMGLVALGVSRWGGRRGK